MHTEVEQRIMLENLFFAELHYIQVIWYFIKKDWKHFGFADLISFGIYILHFGFLGFISHWTEDLKAPTCKLTLCKLRCMCDKLYLDLLDLIVQSSNVSICFLWGLLHLHDCYQGISVVHQHPNHSMNLNIDTIHKWQSNNMIIMIDDTSIRKVDENV